jgi:predicted AlkP superfamily phosphohydrolase/phosphomutase
VKAKLVVLVLEGMSNRLLSAWHNRLPNISSLISKNGGTLHTGSVPYEAPNLVSAFSGLAPGHHGVYSYWHVHNEEYIPQTWNADEIKVPMLWQMEELKHHSFGLLNLFCTYPPYPIHGKMISYLQQPSLRGCFPKEYIKELLRRGYKYTSDVFVGLGYGQDNPISGKNSTPRDEYYRLFEETEKARVDVAMDMMQECDAIIANLTIIDRLSHFFWHEIEAGSPIETEDTLLFKAYSFLDRVVEKFMNVLPQEANLLIFSEIGYGPLINFVSINNYLENNKLLARGHARTEWQKTIAFESVQGSHGVNINVKENYKHGIVSKNDVEKVRHDVMEYLKTVINPKTSLPMFKSVQERENLYDGPFMARAPDIIVEMADERFVPMGDEYWSSRVHRNNQSGWHRKDGVWTGHGISFDGTKKDASVLDIAPTIFDLLGAGKNNKFPRKPLLE